ncbi:hypothetical protein HYALB_00006652 [Hymenoscyphus albidus]|uniref:Uncharacterized protein n=1 Tax=Hymenoscyphus albidus TaxID=595503 RepID=A0A9N9M004_9HELO|nr:hypothetical protein HYALB_00006652 [Hymenoscyphus albidus]
MLFSSTLVIAVAACGAMGQSIIPQNATTRTEPTRTVIPSLLPVTPRPTNGTSGVVTSSSRPLTTSRPSDGTTTRPGSASTLGGPASTAKPTSTNAANYNSGVGGVLGVVGAGVLGFALGL